MPQVQRTKDLTVLPGLSKSSWNESCLELIREYFRDPKYAILAIYFLGKKLLVLLDFPDSSVDDLFYILRAPWQVYRSGDFLVFGSVSGGPANTIFKFVAGIYAPLAYKSQWPDCILYFVMRSNSQDRRLSLQSLEKRDARF
jgi:hypothetical protein